MKTMYTKFYRIILPVFLLISLSTKVQAQCGIKVDIDAIPRTNICLGESVILQSKNNLTVDIPTSCGINLDKTCGSGADSVGTTVGTGAVINGYNSSAPELFGDFGEAQSRSQIIILASELKSSGFSGGKITSMAVDIARLETGKSHTIPNVSIKMSCTSSSNFSSSFFSGLDEVFTPKSVTFTAVGQYVFKFDKAYDWDGAGNIIVEICSYSAAGSTAGTVNWGNFTKDNVPGFASWRHVASANSNGDCVFTGTERNFNQRPNITFNVCRPKVVNLTYLWTPNNGTLNQTNQSSAVATTTVNTRYYVKVTKVGDATCTDTDSIDITVDDPSLFTPASNSPLCEGSTLQFNANTTGNTYFWSGPNGFTSDQQNPSIPNVTPAYSGTYTFLVDKGFCRATKTLTVDIQPVPNTGIPKDSTVCRATTNVNLFGLLTGENPGGTWTDDNASGILTGGNLNPSLLNNAILPKPYTFTYTITNICGTISTPVTVTVVATKSAGIDDDTTLCETGAAVNLLSILDGTPNTPGTWTDVSATGQMSPAGIFTPTNLGPGVYTFNYTVTGNAPCANVTSKVTVNVSDQPFAGDDASASICSNANINLFNQLTNSPKPGGTWTDLDNAGGSLSPTGSFTATSVPAGVYHFKYKVAATAPCLADSSIVTVTVKGPPQIANISSICAADKSTYTVTFELSGGDPTSYNVMPSGTITGTSPKLFTSAPIPDATTVTFTVTDGNACGSSTTTVLKRCACPTQSGTVATTPALQVCNSSTASAIYMGGYATDGDDTLMFVLHTNSGFSLGTVIAQQSSPTFGYSAGIVYGQTYYISAVAGNKLPNNLVDLTDQCLSVSQGVPIVFGQVTAPSFTFSANPICPGDNLVITSSASGNPSYSWSGPHGFTSTAQNPQINNIQEVDSGNYTLTINSNGCLLNTTRKLIVVSKPNITITSDSTVCAGQGGFIYINVNGPAEIYVTYAANPSPGTVQELLQPGINKIAVNPAVNTTYTLVYANYNGGCGYNLTGSATIKVIQVPNASYNAVGETAFCYNESNTGKVAFHLGTGITANLIYSLNGNIQSTIPDIADGFQLDVVAAAQGATVFKLESLTAGSCVFNNPLQPITFYNLIDPIVSAIPSKTVLCQKDSIRLDFSVVASEKVVIDYTVGGFPRTLVTDKDTSIYLQILNNTFINIQKASYQVKSSCNRTISQFFSIVANATPVIDVQATTTACNNTNTGEINVSSQNSTDEFSLDGSQFTNVGNFANLFSGFHNLVVRATNGCTVTQQVEIVAISNLIVQTDILQTSCGYENGEVTLTPMNGKSPYTVLFDGKSVDPGTQTGLKPGTYQILVIDDNNCIKQSSVTILPSTPITISTTDNGLIDCNAPEYSAVFVSPTGGTGNYTYSVPGLPEQTDSVFHGLHPQTYVITVKDDRGCISTKTIKLSSIQKFSIVPLIRKQLLCYEGCDAEIQINTTNAYTPALYSIDNSFYQTDNIFRGVCPGNFTAYVREQGGCYREQSVSFGVTRPTPIDLEIKSSGIPSCWNSPDGFISLLASGGSLQPREFTVNNGANWETNPDFTGLTKGNYTLIARNDHGCHSDTINFYLDGPEDIIINTSFTHNQAKTLAEITVTASGGSPNFVYSINNGQSYVSTNVFSNLPYGTYSACVKDSRNCMACETIVISDVGIVNIDLSESVLLYPNPFNDRFTIRSDRRSSNVKVNILNAIGEVVYEGQFDELFNTPIEISPTQDLAPGVYSLEVRSDQGTAIKKLIKQ